MIYERSLKLTLSDRFIEKILFVWTQLNLVSMCKIQNFLKITGSNPDEISIRLFLHFFKNVFGWMSFKFKKVPLQSKFFLSNFSFVFWKKEIWREKIYASIKWIYTDLAKYRRSYFSPIYNTFNTAEIVGIDRLSPQLHVNNHYINIILL